MKKITEIYGGHMIHKRESLLEKQRSLKTRIDAKDLIQNNLIIKMDQEYKQEAIQ